MECAACGGVWERVPELVTRLLKAAASYEWKTFRVGVRLKGDFENEESRALKSALKQSLGQALEQASQKNVDVRAPDLEFTIELPKLRFSLSSAPVFIEGKYRKLVRYLPQSNWTCRSCNGKGCLDCGFKGRHFSSSVEELIAFPLKVFLSASQIYLHAGGREDVDVRALGEGRPFVVEAANPRRRFFPLRDAEQAVNTYSNPFVEVAFTEFAARRRVSELKASSETNYKVYRGKIVFQLTPRALMGSDVLELSNLELAQRTPLRTLGARSDLVRARKVEHITVRKLDDMTAEFELSCQGGTYVKEFISGDDGRTQPNLSQILGTPSRCVELDLVDVHQR
ncbi:MAG: tRNA pseudouridine(54/55) synthase Pus10 [Thermoprotei archaeon]